MVEGITKPSINAQSRSQVLLRCDYEGECTNMKKYDVRFCSCGRVHFVDEAKINNAIENEKQVLIVCNNCGNSSVIGADIQEDDEGQTCYMMYSSSMRDTEINDMTKIDSIVFTTGEHVRMMTGGEATYHGNEFIDWDTKKPSDISNEEWEKMRMTVNTRHTINWIKDDNKLSK